ncbi:hypothetical protein Hanom_Chr16g01496021 [Helianthus anomalus]
MEGTKEPGVTVPAKRDGAGNRFGFLKLYKISDVNLWLEKLKEVRLEGVILDVKLTKFNRDGLKVDSFTPGERISVFSRLGKEVPVQQVYREKEKVHKLWGTLLMVDRTAP